MSLKRLLLSAFYLPGVYYSSLSGFTDGERYRLYAIQDTLNDTIQSSCFQNELLSSYPQENKWPNTSYVLEEFRALRHEVDVVAFRSSQRIIGYYSTKTKKVYINQSYLNEPDCFLAGTLIHEVSHVLGYRHYKFPKDQSVSYVLARIVRNCCMK